MRIAFLPWVACCLAATTPAFPELSDEEIAAAMLEAAQAAEEYALLFNGCGRLSLNVVVDEQLELGTTDRLRDLPRTRLRAARLLREGRFDSQRFLNVGVDVLRLQRYDGKPMRELAFVVRADLRRHLPDTGHGNDGLVTVWSTQRIGVATEPEWLASAVSQVVDEFMAKYVRANGCTGNPVAAWGRPS